MSSVQFQTETPVEAIDASWLPWKLGTSDPRRSPLIQRRLTYLIVDPTADRLDCLASRAQQQKSAHFFVHERHALAMKILIFLNREAQ